MSNKREVDRIKAHLGRNVESRQVFRKAIVRLPWYSPFRFRNVLIIASLISAMVMSKPLYDTFWAIRRGIRFEKERTKFLRQLDEEEEQEEQREEQRRD